MCVRDVHITGIFVIPWVGNPPPKYPWHQKTGMGTININIFIIDGAHGMLPLPQNTISALNRISSEPGLLKIPCGPWHLGRARAWARAQGFRSGPGTGPGKPWARAQAWARPKCHGPHGIFSRPGSELISSELKWCFGVANHAMGAINCKNMNIDGTHGNFWCQGY